MNKKMIFFDVDGTLMSTGDNIPNPSEKTAMIIKQIHDKGHIPVIATGRPYSMLQPAIKALGCESFVLSNGSYVILEGEEVFNQVIPQAIIEQVEKAAQACNINIWYDNVDYIYITDHNLKTKVDFLIYDGCPEENIKVVHGFDGCKINKFCAIWGRDGDFESFEKELGSFEVIAHLGDDLNFCDANYLGRDKLEGIKTIMESSKIAVEDTYAIGDGGNDVKMLEFVGHGIAMGNAVDKLKAVADSVTTSITDEGVYNAFKDMDWLK